MCKLALFFSGRFSAGKISTYRFSGDRRRGGENRGGIRQQNKDLLRPTEAASYTYIYIYYIRIGVATVATRRGLSEIEFCVSVAIYFGNSNKRWLHAAKWWNIFRWLEAPICGPRSTLMYHKYTYVHTLANISPKFFWKTNALPAWRVSNRSTFLRERKKSTMENCSLCPYEGGCRWPPPEALSRWSVSSFCEKLLCRGV